MFRSLKFYGSIPSSGLLLLKFEPRYCIQIPTCIITHTSTWRVVGKTSSEQNIFGLHHCLVHAGPHHRRPDATRSFSLKTTNRYKNHAASASQEQRRRSTQEEKKHARPGQGKKPRYLVVFWRQHETFPVDISSSSSSRFSALMAVVLFQNSSRGRPRSPRIPENIPRKECRTI